jgi:glycerol-1-phosphate dehydrogenase [NAD(P)+]
VLNENQNLEKVLEEYDGIFAVGSGSVCDYSKLISFNAKKPFIVFGTALSMNGYLSSNASILGSSGFKESFKCHLPKALYFDLKTLQDAPLNLTKAGYGDAMARASAQNDCYLSHIKKGTKYDEDLFAFRLPSERFLLENSKKILEKDDEFTLELLENTLFAGISMHLFGSSFTASGGEHALSHFAEKEFPKITKFLHGLQIAGFTCEMFRIQHQFKGEKFFDINGFNLMEIFKDIQIPCCFEDLELTPDEFEKIKIGAVNVRDRYGFLKL